MPHAKLTPRNSPQVPRSCEAYHRLSDEIANLPASSLFIVNIDIPAAVTTVLGSLPQLNALRPHMLHLPGFDIARFDRLETYALALCHAHGQWVTASVSYEPLEELARTAGEARKMLLSDASALARRKLLDIRAVDHMQSGGYRNLAFDLVALAALFRSNWPAIWDRTAVQPEELDQAQMLAHQLISALGRREQRPAFLAMAAENRQRAFTLFVDAYSEVRRAVTYLRWRERDADKIAPSIYAGRHNHRRPSKPAVATNV